MIDSGASKKEMIPSNKKIRTGTDLASENRTGCKKISYSLYQRVFTSMVKQKQNIKTLSVLIIINFLIAGVGFITQLKIANSIGKASFGLISYGMAIATYCAIFIRFGLDKTLVRDLIHFPDQFAETVKASLLMRFTLFIFVIAAIIILKLTLFSKSDVSWGLILIIISNTAMSVDLQAVFDSMQRMTLHSVYNMIQKSLYFSIIWITLLIDPDILSTLSVGIATFLSVSLYLMLQYVWAMKRFPQNRTSIKDLYLLAYILGRRNIPVWLSALAGLSLGPLNQILLKHYCGPGPVGEYAVAWLMVTILTILITQIARIGNPKIAVITNGTATRLQKISFLQRYLTLILLITATIALPSIIFPKLIIATLFRPEYIDAAPVLRIFGFYAFIVGFDLVAIQYLLSSRIEKAYLYIIIFGGLLSVLLSFLLIPEQKGVGAALALLISHGIVVLLYWIRIGFSLRTA
jgi:O-antigen/teichoic acid export membrane protein